MMMSSWPPSTCCKAGAEPRNGTNWNLLPVTVCSERPLMCGGLARPPVPNVTLSGFAFSHAISSFEVLRRQRVARHDQHRAVRQHRDRLEVLQRVVVERIDRGIDDVVVHAADAERVAVRIGAHDAARADRARCAADVLDDDGLAEDLLRARHHDAADRVGRSARRCRHDRRDGPRRIGLRCRGAHAGEHYERGDEQFPHAKCRPFAGGSTSLRS